MFARIFRHYLPEIPVEVLPTMQSEDNILIKILIWSTQTFGYYDTPRNVPVSVIMEVHCRQWGDSFRAQRFTYEGRMIQENDTPASLGMQDCDTIDIVYAQAAG